MLKYLAFLDGAAFRLDPQDDRLEVAFRQSGVGREVGIRRRREGEHDVQSSVLVSLLVLLWQRFHHNNLCIRECEKNS